MNKIDKEDHFFKSRIGNLIQTVNDKNYPKFSYFLDEHQVCLAESVLIGLKCRNYVFYGHDNNFQRLMLCVYPEYMEQTDIDWPVSVLNFSYNKNYNLSHKDFLGALMALQIKRELIGDMKISSGVSQIVVHNNCRDFILNNVSKVGRVGVCIDVIDDFTLDTDIKFKDITGTIASFRIDNIVALVTKLSRSKSVEIIKASRVSINHKEIIDSSCVVNFNDVITIRGYGKYKVCSDAKKTKKDRYHVTIQKYI